MDTYVENRNTMHVSSQSCLNANADKLTMLPDYPEIKAAFDANLMETGKLLGEQSMDKRGATMEKKTEKAGLVGILMKISRYVVAYATSKELYDLLQKMKLAQSKLDKTADTTLKDKADEILRLTKENLAAVLPYGLTSDMLTDMQEKIDSYFAVVPKPKLTRKRSGELRKEIAQRQKQSDALLVKIDALVATLKDTEPMFCGTYAGARKLGNEGIRHIALKVQVNEAGSGAGISKAMLELAQQAAAGMKAGTDLMKSVKFTGGKGGSLTKSLESGTYLLTVSKAGYVTQTVTVYVTAGEMTGVVVALVKNEE
jgi:hypothetical protein